MSQFELATQLSTTETYPNNYASYLAGRLKHAHRYRHSDELTQQSMVAYPEPRKRLRKELRASNHMGRTPDGKDIYLFDYRLNSSVIRELGRLRELTFRAVGEGTQKLRDNDSFDKIYRHIVLWDDEQAEIVGAYRIGEAYNLVKNGNSQRLYTSTLFDYGLNFKRCFPNAIELGRSFIQPRYWTKRGLDYLWMGIGAYLNTHPDVRYLFGAVSISNDYPELAKQQIVGCYQHHFQPDNASHYATAKLPFRTDRSVLEAHRGKTLAQSILILKAELKKHRVTLPTLYKHYADLCEPQGTRFIDFNIDPGFAFCIDGLILVDLHHIKDNKRRRYLSGSSC